MLPLSVLRRHPRRHRKFFSTAAAATSLRVPLSHPTFMVWASNTSLGKTLVSAGLASSFLLSKPNRKFLYLKPVQTGFPSDSDSRFLFTKLTTIAERLRASLVSSNCVLHSSLPAAKSLLKGEFRGKGEGIGFYELGFREENKILEEREGVSELVCETFYAWEEPISPHLAAERESGVLEDGKVVDLLANRLRIGLEFAEKESLCVVETAGGVASPAPSGTLQCDLYRPFRLPGVLVGDGRLGGISGTISAYESLKLRGYDIVAVVFEDHGLINEVPLLSYLRNRVPVIVLPPVPQDMSNDLMEWFVDSAEVFNSLKEIMLSAYSVRIQRLNEMSKKAGDVLWWPFTQHKLVPEDTVGVIDSRCGENFAVYKAQGNKFLTQQFDACASWWTQGPDATLQTELARDMGYAAARFGHVMFPENVYEPALECTELLLEGVGKGWASRVFFSDNGSTAIEVAIKMAFRKFLYDNEDLSKILGIKKNERGFELKVLALKGSYHGDTLGAMEAQAPSSFTGFLQQPWYTGRGLFVDSPTVFMRDGTWNLTLPEGMHPEDMNDASPSFHSCEEVFRKSRDTTDLARIYSLYLSELLSQYSGLEGSIHVGALIIEPVVHGSGGMVMIDPLFQRVLVSECRSRNIPVIFDEVFTGFWRLGVESTTELLGCTPDIACFAKLMTGGVIPLAVTLATSAVFDSFIGDSKLKALLHGHSYTAHAMGCTAAAKAIKWFKDPSTNHNIDPEKKSLRELWDAELVRQISSHQSVQRVVALGTLFSLELQADGDDAGYASLYARSLVQKLREDGVYMRPLGNVIYMMCGPCTSPHICRKLLLKVQKRLDEFYQAKEKQTSCL